MSDIAGAARGRDVDRPTAIPLGGWIDIGRRVAAEIRRNNLTIVAAGVAFDPWVALIPARSC